MTGTRIGHYEILEKLGEGGMGLVDKARDVLLNRNAALKLLPDEGADADDKRRRFLLEAQAASALNHPNIVTIYEVGQEDGRDFIAMELLQGQRLDEAIARRALPLKTAMAYAIQIADALAAAHAAGIVHRDLKPGNVIVADSGVVKVLDFGLAKLVMPTSSASPATETVLAASPKTTEGTILGTVSYMSPEQAEGKPVDHRSDIFSFGAVVYEMTTGRRAFQGGSTVSTLSAILTAEPPSLSAEVPGAPIELGRIVSRCLRKAPEQRWQSIADVRIALEELKQDLESGRLATPAMAGATVGRSRWMAIVAAAALVIAAIAGFLTWRARPSAPAPEIWRVRRLTSDSGATLSPAISRDGRLVAYVSDRAAGDAMDLWVQQIDGGDAVQLTRNLRFCLDPAFSPDGSRIVVRCDEPPSIYIVPTFGGLPRKLADGEFPRFSPDGSRISYMAPPSGDRSRSLVISSADGTDKKEIKIEKRLVAGPVWRPDGQGFLFAHDDSENAQDRDWYFVATDNGSLTPTGAARRLEAAGLGIGGYHSVTADGVLFTNGSLDSTGVYRMPFDATFQNASGPPVPVVVGAGVSYSPTASQDGRRIAFAIGNNVSTNIWRAPIDPGTGRVTGEPVRVTSSVDQSRVPSPSRDGTRIAYLGGPSGAREVRLRDVATGKDVRLAEAKPWSIVVLSQDGSMVAFNSDQQDNSGIYAVPAAGGVPKKSVPHAAGRWTGRWIARSSWSTPLVHSAARSISWTWRLARVSCCSNTQSAR